MEEQGWKCDNQSDCRKKTTGPDLLMSKRGKRLQIEVKGYPSERYVRGLRIGEFKKKGIKLTQARLWFGECLYTLILAKSADPTLKIAMGLPEMDTYKRKWEEIKWLRDKIGLDIYWINGKKVFHNS